MDKNCVGAGIGFLVGGGLGFLIPTVAFSLSDNSDVATYASFYSLLLIPPSACGGGFIGLVVGTIVEYFEERKHKRTKSS